MADFTAGEERWRSQLGTLRQVVRQELVARQLDQHLPASPPLRVLDLGCGQGTQLLRLAGRGHAATGVDSSPRLLADAARALQETAARAHLIRGDAAEVAAAMAPASFDAVLCHGVLMYLADPLPLLRAIARVLRPGGLVSLLVRNGDALALRPALQGDWLAAAAAFDGPAYQNRIGLQARADRRDELAATLAGLGLTAVAWYGVRVLTDLAADDAPLPAQPALSLLLDCEERAGRTDPYRAVAPLLHLLARRDPAAPDGGHGPAPVTMQSSPPV